MAPTEYFSWVIYFNSLNIVLHFYLLLPMVHSGAGLQSEGKRIVEITSQIMNKPGYDDRQKIDLVFFLSQFKSRNIYVQNAFFKIDWNTFLVVKLTINYS